jgi:hypothetical protein
MLFGPMTGACLLCKVITKNSAKWECFIYPAKSFVVTRYQWLILFSKIWVLLNLVKPALKISKILRIPNMCLFLSAFSVCRVICKFVIFLLNKSCKHIWEQLLPPVGRKWQLIYPNWWKILYNWENALVNWIL